MREYKTVNSSRRSFFLKGGAALGAGLASAPAAASGFFDPSLSLQERLDQLQRQLEGLDDRDAIRHLHLTFTSLVENRAFDAVVELFADEACAEFYGQAYAGKQDGIRELFVEKYGARKADIMQAAYRFDPLQQHDELHIADDRSSAAATFHAQVQRCEPLQDQSSLGAMANLQGSSASSAWENGRFVVTYRRRDGNWCIDQLKYMQA